MLRTITNTFFLQLQLPQEFFVKLNYVLFYRGGHKSRHKTVYHMCKTWLKEVHGGWVWGGDF